MSFPSFFLCTEPRATRPYFDSTQDLLSRFDLLSAYDKYVRPFAPPVGGTSTSTGTISAVGDKGKGKERDGDYEGYDVGESGPDTVESMGARESAVSPDGGRAKSPTNAGANRAVSPAQVAEVYDPAGPQASLASVIMQRNGANARSPSPVVVERAKSPLESLYNRAPASPTVNGFVKPGLQSTINSPTAAFQRRTQAYPPTLLSYTFALRLPFVHSPLLCIFFRPA